MKPSDAITTARRIVMDEAPTGFSARQSDAELLGYFNDGLAEICTLAPGVYSSVGPFICAAGAKQTLLFANAVSLIEVLSITGGVGLTMFDRKAMDGFKPGWRNDTAAAAQQWSPYEGDSLSFLVYPPAIAGQSLDIRYIRNPSTYALSDTVTDLPEALRPAMVDYIVYRAESKDDENVLSQRAQGHYQAFLAKIGAK